MKSVDGGLKLIKDELLIGSRRRAFDWYRHRWLSMTLNGVSPCFALFHRIR